MVLLASGPGYDVDHTAGGGAELSRERVFQHGHLLHRPAGNIAEDGLASPTVVCRCAVHYPGSLAASRAVGDKKVLVHEHIALVDSGPVCRIEQWKICDPAV